MKTTKLLTALKAACSFNYCSAHRLNPGRIIPGLFNPNIKIAYNCNFSPGTYSQLPINIPIVFFAKRLKLIPILYFSLIMSVLTIGLPSSKNILFPYVVIPESPVTLRLYILKTNFSIDKMFPINISRQGENRVSEYKLPHLPVLANTFKCGMTSFLLVPENDVI